MFDLNQEIAEWKRSLGQSESVTGSDLEELESHLRDQIDQLSLSGLSSEEAFLVARHRIGDTKNLPPEFAKVNGSLVFRGRLQWMLIGVVTYLLILNLASLASAAGTLAAFRIGFHGYTTGWMGQAVQFLAVLAGLAMIVVTMQISGIGRLAGSFGGRLFIGLIMIIGLLLLIAARLGIQFLSARTMSVADYGQSSIIQNISELAYSVVIPILVVTVLFLLRRPARQQELGVD